MFATRIDQQGSKDIAPDTATLVRVQSQPTLSRNPDNRQYDEMWNAKFKSDVRPTTSTEQVNKSFDIPLRSSTGQSHRITAHSRQNSSRKVHRLGTTVVPRTPGLVNEFNFAK